MFKDEIQKLRLWYRQFIDDQNALEIKSGNTKAFIFYLVWTTVLSEIFFNSIVYVPITLLLFSPLLFFLFEYVKIYKKIQIQDKIKYIFELTASYLQGGLVIDSALMKAFDVSLGDEELPKGLRSIIQENIYRLKFNLENKYSLASIGNFASTKSISRIDWICEYCVQSGLEIDSVYLQCARSLGRQQIYRRELLKKLSAKQQEFSLMMIAPVFVKFGTASMMGEYFTSKNGVSSEIFLGITLSLMYVCACSLYLYTNNQMLRGTYENL